MLLTVNEVPSDRFSRAVVLKSIVYFEQNVTGYLNKIQLGFEIRACILEPMQREESHQTFANPPVLFGECKLYI